MKALPTHTGLNSFIIQPESYGATVDEGFIVGGPVGDFELCFATERSALSGRCVIDLQLSKVRFIQQSLSVLSDFAQFMVKSKLFYLAQCWQSNGYRCRWK